MSEYHFKTREWGVSDQGIHFFRSGFNYKTYRFSDIRSFEIRKGKEVNNWIVLLVVVIVLVLTAVAWGWFWKNLSFKGVSGSGGARMITGVIMLPFFTFFLGSYCIYSSIRNGTILPLNAIDNTIDFVSLRDIEKDGKLKDLQQFLLANLH